MSRCVAILAVVILLTSAGATAWAGDDGVNLDSVKFPFGIKLGMDILDALSLVKDVGYSVEDMPGENHSSVMIMAPVKFGGHEVGLIFYPHNESKRIEKITIIFDSLGGMIERTQGTESIYAGFLDYILGIFGEPDVVGGEIKRDIGGLKASLIAESVMAIRNGPTDRIWVRVLKGGVLCIVLSGDLINSIDFIFM